MAKSKSPPQGTPKASFGSYGGKPRPFTALFFLVMGTLLTLSFIIFDIDQSPFKTSDGPLVDSLLGKFGIYVPFSIIWGFGISAWVIAFFCFWLGYKHLVRHSHLLKWPHFLSLFIFTFSVSIFGSLGQEMFFFDEAGADLIHNEWNFANGLGGMAGNLLYWQALKIWLGPIGTIVIVGLALILSFLALFTSGLADLMERLALQIANLRQARGEKDGNKAPLFSRLNPFKRSKSPASASAVQVRVTKPIATKPSKEPKKKPLAERFNSRKKEAPAAPPKGGKEVSKGSAKLLDSVKPRKARENPIPHKMGNYEFPALELLAVPAHRNQELNQEEYDKTATDLKATLESFGVRIKDEDVEVLPGPVITRYEVKPATGIKVSKILGLNNDIALGLKAMKVRIQAPVPGKGTVGIEVPNKEPDSVYMRDLIESEDWAKFKTKADIPIALGKEVSGQPLLSDLTKMPHLLVAGATGSGKTVCINSIITSLLYNFSPEDMRLIMVDPKIVEMQVYNDLPHMLIPVVTEAKKVPGALKWLIAEMQRRYEVFAKVGARNIAGYNKKQKSKVKENKPVGKAAEIEVPRDPEVEIPDKYPYIVCFIDELADLMMVAQKDVETSIARLAQLARAAGIHLIIATQRPSTNVITGIIKANLPSRIAFQTSSGVDSRTILDQVGAEQLIGRGDMLFNPPGSSQLVRAQGCFVSDEEINDIVEYLKRNGPPQFAPDVQRQVESGGEEDDSEMFQDDRDDMYPKAIEVLRTSSRASTSMLQRRLKIGYNRAARIMDLMEENGIVGPENGPQPREILVDLDSL